MTEAVWFHQTRTWDHRQAPVKAIFNIWYLKK